LPQTQFSSSDFYYLIYTSFHTTDLQVDVFHDELIQCEIDRLIGYNNTEYYIFIAFLLVICGTSVLFGLAIVSAHFTINKHWKDFYTTFKNTSLMWRQAWKKRKQLFFHNIIDEYTNASTSDFKLFKNRNIILSFSIRVLLIVALFLSLYTVANLVLLDRIENILATRMLLFNLIADRRTSIIYLSHFLLDSVLTSKNVSLQQHFGGFTVYPDPGTSINKTLSDLTDLKKRFVDQSIQGILSSNLHDLFYSSVPQDQGYLKYGVVKGYDELEYTSQFIAFSGVEDKDTELRNYVNNIKSLAQFYNTSDTEIDTCGLDAVNLEFYYLILFACVSIVILVVLALFYAYAYFGSEEQVLKEMDSVMSFNIAR
jgi:hypothetical protein